MAKYLNPPKYKIESKGIKSVRDRTGNISDCLSKKWDIATFRQKLINEILKKRLPALPIGCKRRTDS